MLQENPDVLRQQLLDDFLPDKDAMEEMREMGFDAALIKLALRAALNDKSGAIESLVKMQSDGTYEALLNNVSNMLADEGATESATSCDQGAVGGEPSSSTRLANKIKLEQQTLEV